LRERPAQVSRITKLEAGVAHAPRAYMKTLALLALSLSAAVATAGGEDEQTLDATSLQHYFRPYVAGVRDCYANARTPAADGSLRIELLIHRDGSVIELNFQAGGIAGDARLRLGTCLRSLSETWHFPPRRAFTSAMLPFSFERAHRTR
jgi:hypothetical protein